VFPWPAVNLVVRRGHTRSPRSSRIRDIRPMGLARDPRLPHRLRHDTVLQRRHVVWGPGGQGRQWAGRTTRCSSGCRWVGPVL